MTDALIFVKLRVKYVLQFHSNINMIQTIHIFNAQMVNLNFDSGYAYSDAIGGCDSCPENC